MRCVGGLGWSGGGQSSIMDGGGICIVFGPCTYHGDSNVTMDLIPDHHIVTILLPCPIAVLLPYPIPDHSIVTVSDTAMSAHGMSSPARNSHHAQSRGCCRVPDSRSRYCYRVRHYKNTVIGNRVHGWNTMTGNRVYS